MTQRTNSAKVTSSISKPIIATQGLLSRVGGREARPWGWFEILAIGLGYQVKRLSVEPGRRLSLQWHRHRQEHWVVARGSARVTIGADSLVLSPGGTLAVPKAAIHRLENASAVDPLEIVEVQIGAYLGEDDIVRIQDDFGRVITGKGAALIDSNGHDNHDAGQEIVSVPLSSP